MQRTLNSREQELYASYLAMACEYRDRAREQSGPVSKREWLEASKVALDSALALKPIEFQR